MHEDTNQVLSSILMFFMAFQTYSKSHHQNHLLVERRGRILSHTSDAPFSWTRFWCRKWRCRTRSSSTRTRGPPCASTARSCSRGSSGRACSAKVGRLLPPRLHQPEEILSPPPSEITFLCFTTHPLMNSWFLFSFKIIVIRLQIQLS